MSDTGSATPRIALIAAVASNGVIGRDNGLPWHLPDDFAWFKRRTMGHPMVMGRRNWESLGRPLPGRRHLVISRSLQQADGAEVFADLFSAFAAAGKVPEIMVIGGAEIYRLALPWAHDLYYTRVDASPEGDVFFPPVDWTAWRLVSAEAHPADKRHAYGFRIEHWSAAKPPPPWPRPDEGSTPPQPAVIL